MSKKSSTFVPDLENNKFNPIKTIMTHTNSEYCKYADVIIEWKETQKQESVKVALFPPEEMNLEADGLTDDDIFFYFINPNGLIANRLGLDAEDFKIVKVIKMY